MKSVLFFLFVLISCYSFAQHKNTEKLIVTYDPSFWKRELRLDNFQYRRMCEINLEFYQRLITAYRSLKDDRKAFHSAFAECWINRNTQLLQTMNARQRKKWSRM